MTLRIIGDIHGNFDVYRRMVKDVDHSIQIGDIIGKSYDFSVLSEFSPNHKFFGGNHDHYPNMMAWDGGHHLGHFGVYEVPGFGPVFFVRGGWSINHKALQQGVSWWPEEQLNYRQCLEAIELYKSVKPSLVLSHECPQSVVPYVTQPEFVLNFGYTDPNIKTQTSMALEAMLDHHQPKMWAFGHYHRSQEVQLGDTRFVCVGIYQCMDVEPELTGALQCRISF